MVVLTDGSVFAHALVPHAGAVHGAGALAPRDRALWLALDGGPRVAQASFELPGTMWSRIVVMEATPRSHVDALAAAGAVLPGPVAALAGTSPRFRGFHGRTWESRPGNLHLSAAIPLTRCGTEAALTFVLFPTLAARDAIVSATEGAVAPQIKWINDLYVAGGKAAGILLQTETRGSAIELLLVGIGVNVGCAPPIAPTPFVPATAVVPGVDLGRLFREMLLALQRRYEQAIAGDVASLLEDYRSASLVLGRTVRIYPQTGSDSASPDDFPQAEACGVVLEIRQDLSLVIGGLRQPISRGRLAFEEDCREFGLPPV